MHDNPCTRRRVVVTMTRGDEAGPRAGEPLQFESLGGAVLGAADAAQGGDWALATWPDAWGVYPLQGRCRPARRRVAGRG